MRKSSLEKIQGVYCIRSKRDRRVYIGSGVDIRRRFSEHKTKLNQCKSDNSSLQLAWNKHGAVGFEFLILELVSNVIKLDEREQYWIGYCNATNPRSGYNMHTKARNVLGVKFPFYRR